MLKTNVIEAAGTAVALALAPVPPDERLDDFQWPEGVSRPPTQDELPYDDGMPMESQRHGLQLPLLSESLKLHWGDRDDYFVGGNMFVYFSLEQVRNRDFRGPDFFVVLGVPAGERKSWVVWDEGKGPDVVIEFLSESTAATDKEESSCSEGWW